MQPEAVDLARRDDLDRDVPRRAQHREEERLSLLGLQLLRVVQPRERGEPATAQVLVVEQDGRRDERPGEAAATCLVRPGDETRVETPIERDEPAAAAARRRHRILDPAGVPTGRG